MGIIEFFTKLSLSYEMQFSINGRAFHEDKLLDEETKCAI